MYQFCRYTVRNDSSLRTCHRPPCLPMAQEDTFGCFLKKRLEQTLCTYKSPWRLVVYADEVTPGNALKAPGNALKAANYRRVLCWSFLDFCRRCYRSAQVSLVQRRRRPHSAAQVLPEGFLCTARFASQTLSHGQRVLFAKLSVLLADEAALKHSVESEGAAGFLFCARCSNVVPHESRLVDVRRQQRCGYLRRAQTLLSSGSTPTRAPGSCFVTCRSKRPSEPGTVQRTGERPAHG